jgi:hypothetical protein
MFALLVLSASLSAAAEPAAPQPVWIQLGPANAEHALASPSGGDGTTAAETLAGSPCRRTSGEKSRYIYFQADARLLPPGCYDAYVTVEYLDDRADVVRVQYDQAPVDRPKNSCYTTAEDLILRMGSRQWQQAVVHLPNARMGHGQNFAADFRLMGQELAVRRVTVSFTRPADYRAGGIDQRKLEQFAASIGRGMELDIGDDTDRGESALFRMLGATSVESYVTWQSVEDAGEGRWDWSRWDRQVEILRGAGLKWAPLLVCGPAYAIPKWYRDSDRSVPYVCLEHGEPSKIQSLWNPALRPWVERFVRAFAERYRDSGVLELVRLGVTGVYGETLYPTGVPSPSWVNAIPGPYHNHTGWWAGDRFARASFRETFRLRYGDVGRLNRAWGTSFASLEAVEPIIPEKCPTLRARADFVEWYMQSMTEYGAFWSAVARKHFPHTPIYHSLGGSGQPLIGADFSAQARAFAPYQSRLRVTNEGSDYGLNFAITREVVSASRAFGLDCGFEPAGPVTADGNTARIYNATASGGVHLFCYKGNILQSAESLAAFRQSIGLLQRRRPLVRTALYLPKIAWMLDDGGSHRRTLAAARELRKRVDCELLDRTTLATPLARQVRVLAVPEAEYAEAAEIEQIRRWVAGGGILVARRQNSQPLLRTPEGSDGPCQALLAACPSEIRVLRPKSPGAPPRHFRLELGAAHDAAYLSGDWYQPEPAGMFGRPAVGTMRWTGARAGLYLPCNPAVDATLVLTVHVTTRSLPGANRVLLGGSEIGRLDKSGVQTYRFAVPRRLLAGQSAATLILEPKTFHPSDFGSGDSRELGVAVHVVELIARGADAEPAVATPLVWEVDWPAAAGCIRRIGQGATLCVPTDNRSQFSEAVVAVLRHVERVVPGAPPVRAAVSDVEGVYVTELADGFLYYNATGQPQTADGLAVPARGIGWRAK